MEKNLCFQNMTLSIIVVALSITTTTPSIGLFSRPCRIKTLTQFRCYLTDGAVDVHAQTEFGWCKNRSWVFSPPHQTYHHNWKQTGSCDVTLRHLRSLDTQTRNGGPCCLQNICLSPCINSNN